MARCLVHYPIARRVYEKYTGKCRFCFFHGRKNQCFNHDNGCTNYKPKESEQIVSSVERVPLALSADELRTLMNALTVLNHQPLVPADEYPFPRQALYAYLRTKLEQAEGWKAR